ncbi:MAG: beta-N-acetylglucosaminidase domain-containing protein, partial [Elusimicrobia bacterium]|nr:beta-N-acetylglucosaminidase domain-containing protein [Elusimicrobiota bacterium]
GFYGRPWSWSERRAMADWMSGRRMHLLVIAPKDDPSLRDDWRRPMADAERSELKRLVDRARERFVEVAWSLSPGLDLAPQSEDDLAAALGKLEAAAQAGVRKFVIAFDDVDPSRGQVRFANRLLAELAPKLPGAEWTFIPAEYWGEAAPSPYLARVARELDDRFAIGWTGGQVLARRITLGEAERFGRYIRHRLVLGDNYPAQDRLWGAGRLFWGPLVGRDPALPAVHSGFVANASPLAAASRIPLATAAEYAWDPVRYDPAGAWRHALASESADGDALVRFAAYNCSSWLQAGPLPVPRGGTALRSASRLEDELESAALAEPSPGLKRELRDLSRLRADLGRELAGRPELREQVEPWAAKLEAQARAAAAVVSRDGRADGLIEAADRLGIDIPRFCYHPGLPVAGNCRMCLVDTNRSPKPVASCWDPCQEGHVVTTNSGLAPGDLRPAAERIESFAGGRPGSRVLLAAALDRLGGGPAMLARAAGESADLWRGLVPWVGLLADAADRARAAVDGAPAGGRDPRLGGRDPQPGGRDPRPGGRPSWWRDRIWRWRARGHFVSLVAARTLLDDYFDRVESPWTGGRARGLPPSLRAWLWLTSRTSPGSVPVRLADALDRERAGDARALRRLLEEFSSLPALVRERLPGQLAEEGTPWLDKVGEYGRLGILTLDLKRRERKPGEDELERWKESRYRVRSSNGLELVVELKLALDAFVEWSGLPIGERPPVPELRLPADPREML